jgi:hypothetical protein
MLDYSCSLDPESLLLGQNGQGASYLKKTQAMDAVASVFLRLGPERARAAVLDLLSRTSVPSRVVVAVARGQINGGGGGIKFISLEPQAIDMAVRRLREALGDPDPLVRAGAAYGLGDAGERGRATLPALEPLKNDADPRVRQAAAEAIQKTSGA